VFPSFDGSCVSVPIRVPGKVEVYECDYGNYLLRYSRWAPEADRVAYLDSANHQPLKYPWSVDYEIAGTEWWSEDHKPTESLPYQYSATYRDSPFSVSVEGLTKADRATGVDRLDATPPSKIGLG
jgi:hypothetical protein